jgi:phospholipase C
MMTIGRTCLFGFVVLAASATVVAAAAADSTTPIRHLVVIFQENNSFDHYFGTYPVALNPPGEPPFQAQDDTPTVNGLGTLVDGVPQGVLLTDNPNANNPANNNAAKGMAAVNPFRLDRSQAFLDCNNSNAYANEQLAADFGLMDAFPLFTGAAPTAGSGDAVPCPAGVVMGYYDGNTVTALWNYAQHFAMSDNFFDTEFGATLLGHLNLISGQTHQTNTANLTTVIRNGSVVANLDSALDDCTSGAGVPAVAMTGHNIGDLLNNAGITWGWFYADFTAQPGSTPTQAVCSNYDVHYDPFQYYPSTVNPHHLPPTSVAMIGHQGDQADHQYDLNSFSAALNAGNLPAVSFLKATSSETGHPQDGSVLAEQTFLVDTINALQKSKYWPSMAIIVTYDDSDGWYDHVMPPIVNRSNDPSSTVPGGLDSICAIVPPPATAFNDRCGYGQRLPFLVISPYAKRNYVDHATLDTTSVLRFIEDNWQLGRIDSLDNPGGTPPGQGSFDQLAGSIESLFDFDDRDRDGRDDLPLLLNDSTGEVVSPPASH